MPITTMRRHTARPGSPELGKSLPIVRYHELQLHGPFASTIITVVEDGMWRSNIMRLAQHTAAEIVEGLTGIPRQATMQRMKNHQRSFPDGEKYPVPSSYTARRFGKE